MADDGERFEAEIDLDVTFNEFDEEICNSKKSSREHNVEKIISDDNRVDTPCSAATGDRSNQAGAATNGTAADGARNLIKEEDGEISSSSDGEGEEKMDCDEETDIDQKSVPEKLTKSAEDLEKTDNFTFLSPNSVFKEFDKKGCFVEEYVSDTGKREAESAILSMESDSSMDDQSWKRHKRARLEESNQECGEGKSNIKKDEQRDKKRGGRKKRKRGLRRHHEHEPQHRNSRYNHNERESGNEKVLQSLRVSSDDSEQDVAREIADKLNESKIMLIQRVVACIGCEKAIKLFKDTQEVERHGGMWTKDRDRRRTSGGVFLALLKHRYVDKEQSKWIFAIENEIVKRKAKEEQQRMKEFHKRNVTDLRLKLKERDKEELQVVHKTLQE